MRLPASNSHVREAKNPQMRGILATPMGTLHDIDTLLLFRKRPKGQCRRPVALRNTPGRLKPHRQGKRSMTNASPGASPGASPEAVLGFIDVGEGRSARKIAVRSRAGGGPGLVWLGGFKSDMQGGKAVGLDAWAKDHGRAVGRVDYSGHGESRGGFAGGTIGSWPAGSGAGLRQVFGGPR